MTLRLLSLCVDRSTGVYRLEERLKSLWIDAVMGWRGIKFYWRSFLIAFTFLYVLTMPLWLRPFLAPRMIEMEYEREQRPKPLVFKKVAQSTEVKSKVDGLSSNFVHKMKYKGRTLFVEDILVASGQPNLRERLTVVQNFTKKFIFSASSFQQPNLGGCPEWNCEVNTNQEVAHAYINSQPASKGHFHGYVLMSSQESPINYGGMFEEKQYFNMTIGFRHDSPVASPYGYTVKLAPQSWTPVKNTVNSTLIRGKTKTAAWFVSHCSTNSGREALVKKLQEYVDVDVYGACGKQQCTKGEKKCEDMLNTDYYFYLALENSICRDYITEKFWSQGYQHTIVPIVLKRSIVEPYAPPNSFIAFDDYSTVEEMSRHLILLTRNLDEYMKYFAWRERYEVIFLDGLEHDELERPVGICQLCRLLQMPVLPVYTIPDIRESWSKSCEADGELANRLLGTKKSI